VYINPLIAEAAQALNQSVNLFLEIGRLNMAARYSKVNKVLFCLQIYYYMLLVFTSGYGINDLRYPAFFFFVLFSPIDLISIFE
jgi:hypothetical protein